VIAITRLAMLLIGFTPDSRVGGTLRDAGD
jgi:hypothetical protein